MCYRVFPPFAITIIQEHSLRVECCTIAAGKELHALQIALLGQQLSTMNVHTTTITTMSCHLVD